MPYEPHAEGAHFRQGQSLATAVPATKAGIPEASARQIRTESLYEVPTHIKGLLDDHIKGLLDDIRTNALSDVRDEEVRLTTQYSDVFPISDLDLGEFTAIEHQLQARKARGTRVGMGNAKIRILHL